MSKNEGYIWTYTDHIFWPMNPRAEDIFIEDIAHALSLLCRFNGHMREFYSVAQHSVLASSLVPREHMLAALLHDASEAYLSDIVHPVKHHENMRAYREAESVLEGVLEQKFAIDIHTPEVKEVDCKLLWTEMRDLLTPQQRETDEKCFTFHITPWSSIKAETIFLDRYAFLDRVRTERALSGFHL